jgi:putative intracellular protease/amidase
MAASSYKPGSPTLQVLIPIFPDFNTFDVNGPIEVLSQAIRNFKWAGPPPFEITIAAATELTASIEGVRMARDISLANAIERLTHWDILLVPGGTEKAVLSSITAWKEAERKELPAHELMMLVNRYMDSRDGFTFTVCTGSLFLGALGKLRGRRATSHWAALPTLKKLCEDLADGMLVKLHISF